VWKWTDRIGMILVFFAFWFAAPELLGEETLRRYTKGGLFAASFLLACLVWLVVFLFLGGALLLLYSAAFSWMVPTISAVLIQRGEKPDPGPIGWVILIVAGLVASYAASATWDVIARLVVNPILLRLANNTTLRRRLLNVGMAMFAVGSACQFTASFFD
jgi:hypothetical protein